MADFRRGCYYGEGDSLYFAGSVFYELAGAAFTRLFFTEDQNRLEKTVFSCFGYAEDLACVVIIIVDNAVQEHGGVHV